MDKRKYLVIETKEMDTQYLQSKLNVLSKRENDLKVESTIGTRLIVSYIEKDHRVIGLDYDEMVARDDDDDSDGTITAESLIEGMRKIANQQGNQNRMSSTLKPGI